MMKNNNEHNIANEQKWSRRAKTVFGIIRFADRPKQTVSTIGESYERSR